MNPKGSQFHPSRDQRPTEYGLGDTMETSNQPLAQPMQGHLFDADRHETENRMALGRQRFVPENAAASAYLEHATENTRIPSSHLQPRRGVVGVKGWSVDKAETNLTLENQGRPWRGSGVAGWYMGPTGYDKGDTIALNPETGHGTDVTFTHEAGHRRHLGETPTYDDSVTHPHAGFRTADPLKEGVADAYADRYAGPTAPQVRFMKEDIAEGTPFASHSFTGYSTDEERGNQKGWTRDDRALYAATRAHAGETGEQPTYVPRGRHVMENTGMAVAAGGSHPTIDATLHTLMNASPHAREALKNVDLTSGRMGNLLAAGEEASRRHMDRQLLTEGQNIQHGMFHELVGDESGKVRGYTPNADALPQGVNNAVGMSEDMEDAEAKNDEVVFPRHMSRNQFGEAPRTQRDVNLSLGVNAKNAEKMGFTAV